MTETGDDALAGYNAMTYGVKTRNGVSTGTGLAASDYVATGEGVTAVVGLAASSKITAELGSTHVGTLVKPAKKADLE